MRLFPKPGTPGVQARAQARPQSWGITWAQTAIIPTNSVIDASAAASSTNIFNIPASMERKKNNVPFLFSGVKGSRSAHLMGELFS